MRGLGVAALRGLRGRLCPSAVLVGMGFWIVSPTVVAQQDMAALVGGLDGAGPRWGISVESAAAGSVQRAEMPFSNADALSGGGVKVSGLGTVAFLTKTGEAASTPDEMRVRREGKQGRVVRIAPVSPPRNFNAGSLFERTSGLLRPAVGPEVKMAFAAPDIKGREERIAATFHPKAETPAPDPGLPVMLASLVNNSKADVLATAYAPAEPDYEKVSPFEALLRDADPSGGRFIPPVEQGDHAWMATPLPASVFSEAEQTCLATGIYFEARGEKLRGQAAVAQVILNRVRNPAYPKTICGVVYQNKRMRNACQFSFACDGIPDVILNRFAYRTAKDVAMAVTAGKIFIPEIGSSTHYYADYVSPSWARAMERMKKIGRHIFYRTYGGGWS